MSRHSTIAGLNVIATILATNEKIAVPTRIEVTGVDGQPPVVFVEAGAELAALREWAYSMPDPECLVWPEHKQVCVSTWMLKVQIFAIVDVTDEVLAHFQAIGQENADGSIDIQVFPIQILTAAIKHFESGDAR